jgi:hypothetical protein
MDAGTENSELVLQAGAVIQHKPKYIKICERKENPWFLILQVQKIDA